MTTWIKDGWRLRDDLPDTFDLAIGGNPTLYDMCFHTPECKPWSRNSGRRVEGGWVNQIPEPIMMAVWRQTPDVVIYGQPEIVEFCQHCMIQKVPVPS